MERPAGRPARHGPEALAGYEPNAQGDLQLALPGGFCPTCGLQASLALMCVECRCAVREDCAVTVRDDQGNAYALCNPCYQHWQLQYEQYMDNQSWLGLAMQRRMTGALADAAAVLAQRGGEAAGSAVAAIVMSTLRFGTGLVRGAAATVQTTRPALEPAPVDTSFDSIPEDNLTRPFFEDLLGDRNELPGDLLPEGAPAPAAAQPPPASSEYNVRRNPLLDDVPVSIRRNLAETTGPGGQQPMDGGGSASPAAVVANPQHGAGVDDRVLTALGSMASQMSILIAKVSSLEESFNDVNARLHEAEAQIQEVRQRPARGQTQIVNYTSDDDFFCGC